MPCPRFALRRHLVYDGLGDHVGGSWMPAACGTLVGFSALSITRVSSPSNVSEHGELQVMDIIPRRECLGRKISSAGAGTWKSALSCI